MIQYEIILNKTEMSLSIIKNILNLEDHELVKARLEEKELNVEIKLETNEHCIDFHNFLTKFNLQSVQRLCFVY